MINTGLKLLMLSRRHWRTMAWELQAQESDRPGNRVDPTWRSGKPSKGTRPSHGYVLRGSGHRREVSTAQAEFPRTLDIDATWGVGISGN